MITMKGAAVSAKLKEQVEKGLETLTWVPKLTIIRVGENPDDISYEKGATKKLTSFGLEVESKVFPGDISDEAFKKEFAAINADASVDGILMLRPLPKQINEQDIEKMIDPAKDLDGISPVNIAKVFSGDTSGFAPCTAEAVVCMLKMNDIALSGKRVAVVGRSMVVGRPLSKQINEQDIEKMIDPAKDLDGISPVNIAKVFSGDTSGFAPCTAEAVVCMLKMNDIALSGKRVAVVGRSMVVGRPLSMLLLHENATVTICHSRTASLPEVCREADILTACVGKAAMINHTYVKKDAVVIDVGINVDENGKLCGDVDFADLEGTASAATPVPGGVGGVTTAVLAQHLVRAAWMKQEKNSNK
ncbi:bifunctional methylenetetrahydrofolate dehydrogenase/methenyltetrahydrofolate cyclohydrolase [Clostridium sp.]|uniref:bifunctional methylenetetrahydrofolate dehydrogenase/methenyltetrahydrofolate cyclohydrolase n=1 Tax=Clostridium sp. TaxID=1506 RepID=UPI0030780317